MCYYTRVGRGLGRFCLFQHRFWYYRYQTRGFFKLTHYRCHVIRLFTLILHWRTRTYTLAVIPTNVSRRIDFRLDTWAGAVAPCKDYSSSTSPVLEMNLSNSCCIPSLVGLICSELQIQVVSVAGCRSSTLSTHCSWASSLIKENLIPGMVVFLCKEIGDRFAPVPHKIS